MNNLIDVLLGRPIAYDFMQVLLFTLFLLHMIFVLLMLGTAILSLYYLFHPLWKNRLDEIRWDKKILKTFTAHKSLAVVLGVGTLLLFQVYHTVPFFTGINFFAPFWLSIIILLVVSFVILDTLGHKIKVHPYLHLSLGLFALILLLIVPAIFVAVLVATENPDKWTQIVNDGNILSGALAWHWLARYMHVLGAGVVFGAAFHYFFLKEADAGLKNSLLKWMIYGILFQFLVGILLYISIPHDKNPASLISLVVGIVFAIIFLVILFVNQNKNKSLNKKTVIILLSFIIVPMLLTRQFLQHETLGKFEGKLNEHADIYKQKLKPYLTPALKTYKKDLEDVVSEPAVIYQRSCSFCHGATGNGDGFEAKNLTVKPEHLSQVRTTREHIYYILTHGVPGTAMPYFTFLDKNKIEGIIDYLHSSFHILDFPDTTLPMQVSIEAFKKSQGVYDTLCAVCHGNDGRGTDLAKGFNPYPPDFTEFSLTPQRTFDVITNGYPGTMMVSFKELPEEVRWGLVKIVLKKRQVKATQRERKENKQIGEMKLISPIR